MNKTKKEFYLEGVAEGESLSDMHPEQIIQECWDYKYSGYFDAFFYNNDCFYAWAKGFRKGSKYFKNN